MRLSTDRYSTGQWHVMGNGDEIVGRIASGMRGVYLAEAKGTRLAYVHSIAAARILIERYLEAMQ